MQSPVYRGGEKDRLESMKIKRNGISCSVSHKIGQLMEQNYNQKRLKPTSSGGERELFSRNKVAHQYSVLRLHHLHMTSLYFHQRPLEKARQTSTRNSKVASLAGLGGTKLSDLLRSPSEVL